MWRRVLALVVVAACSHGEPYATGPPDPLGPADPNLPRQLTFTTGDDRSPTVAGSAVTFSRFDPYAALGECVALLPAEGGTLITTWCPPAPSPADTLISSWLEPSLAPDGRRIAYVWRRSDRISVFSGWSYDLVIASVDSPRVALVSHPLTGLLPGNRVVNTAVDIVWTDPEHLRFLAAFYSVGRVYGGGTSRYTDTVTIARALMDFDAATGVLEMATGGDSVRAWAHGPGITYVVPDQAPTTVLALASDGTRTAVGTFGMTVTDLASAGTRLVAAVGDNGLLWIEPGTTRSGRVLLPGLSRRLAAYGADRVVAEVERRGGDAFGAPANLWLVPLPE